MTKLHALIVGVSNYSTIGNLDDLPFCKNDILLMRDALVNGLNVEMANILSCGEDGIVTKQELQIALQRLVDVSSHEDIIFFYFSGHGGHLSDGHNLALSDDVISTREIIGDFECVKRCNRTP
jgi:hypothetical protein